MDSYKVVGLRRNSRVEYESKVLKQMVALGINLDQPSPFCYVSSNSSSSINKDRDGFLFIFFQEAKTSTLRSSPSMLIKRRVGEAYN